MLLWNKWNQPWMTNESLRSAKCLICSPPWQWICIIRCIQTQTKINWQKCNSLWKTNHKYLWGEVGHTISKLCAGKLTKNVLPGRSAEPVGAHWDGKITNEWSNGNETCPNITKLKHVQNGENVMFCRKRNNILCVLRQVMQSANCELTRQLKHALC